MGVIGAEVIKDRQRGPAQRFGERQSLVGVEAYCVFTLGCARGSNLSVAAGVLNPVSGILMSPMFAGAAMALSPFTVVMNALRLNRVKL